MFGISGLLAATFSFSATATGVDVNTPLEFFLVGRNSDRAYEAMFVLESSTEEFCNGLEKAGFPRGKPINVSDCVLWPTGCELKLEPAMDKFVKSELPEGVKLPPLVYTGGTRETDGSPVAENNMPGAVFALYDCPQSAIQFNGSFEQSVAYGWHKALKTLKKGDRYRFTLAWDDKTRPQNVELEFKPGNHVLVLKTLKEMSEKGEVDALIAFSGDLTVSEATAAAGALQIIDSPRVKINGRKKNSLYYRAFLPLIKWQSRQERLVQPFELTLNADGTDKLLYIDEDWSGEGSDPKLTEKPITYEDTAKYSDTDTCFITVGRNEKLKRVYDAMKKLDKTAVKNWYIFLVDKP